jgi:hypothetical protein
LYSTGSDGDAGGVEVERFAVSCESGERGLSWAGLLRSGESSLCRVICRSASSVRDSGFADACDSGGGASPRALDGLILLCCSILFVCGGIVVVPVEQGPNVRGFQHATRERRRSICASVCCFDDAKASSERVAFTLPENPYQLVDDSGIN